MRPIPGLDSVSTRSRKQSDPTDRPNLTPTTFFLTRDLDARPIGTPNSSTVPDTSPVRSLKSTLEEADRHSKNTLPQQRQEVRSSSRRRSTIKPITVDDTRVELVVQQPSTTHTSSGALTPPASTSQEPSLLGSPKSISSRSYVRSDDELTQDDTSSQAIVSSEDERDEEPPAEAQDSAPQLIMPSIRMPSRRPFTERGKQIGRYKILVTGSEGSGSTSLIKSIVQLCEDIVHVDSISSSTRPVVNDRNNTTQPVSTVNEIYASTRPYPSWWSEVDESRVLKRRKSVGDAVLERNVCFVHSRGSSRHERVIQYLEQQMIQSVGVINQCGNDLIGLISGKGGVQVDVILYLLTKDTLKEDCNNIRRMSQYCGVIPLISKVDLLSSDLISELKGTNLPATPIPYLPFSRSPEQSPQACAPYGVSSANGTDLDNMDASLLMSPEYVRPLVPSELALLVHQLFDPDTVAFLRHTSAKKLVLWYATEPRLTRISSPSIRSPQPSTLNSPIPTSLSNSGVLIPLTSEFSLNTSNSYALAKIADHTQREEHLAQIRLSKWAGDLQLSLQRERERYECLAQNERALWLVQRMGEQVRDGQLIPLPSTQTVNDANKKSRTYQPDMRFEVHDPLGLLRWQDSVSTGGWAALQIIGSFGVMGGVALWLAKTWGFTNSLYTWVQDYLPNVLGTNE